ncbi:DUF5348 domain-containing protein [Ktedonosporobacter rubrisoli]|uniref:DUF5348 domain-containing protein n=1 Tax=Ktedonosporobacter rubrisoli TaxID=2509675 RepID=UPI0013EEC081
MKIATLAYIEDHLELDGKALQRGDKLEICILGHWIWGRIERDTSGWYIVTPEQVGIRLSSRIPVRFPGTSISNIS